MENILAILASAVVSGIVTGITLGVSTRVSNTIANPSHTRPRRRKSKITFKKLLTFIVLTVIIYLTIKAAPFILALI